MSKNMRQGAANSKEIGYPSVTLTQNQRFAACFPAILSGESHSK
jgi:hypothetical protein